MKRFCITIFVTILFAQTCPAPIYSPFRGLDMLIDGSSLIAVARVYRIDEPNRVSAFHGTFKLHILKVLKGGDTKNPIARRTTAALRFLPYGTTEWTFKSQHTYLLFLRDSGVEGVAYQNLNTEGSHWELPSPGSGDLGKIDNIPVKKAIALLLQDSLELKKRDAALREKAVASILRDLEKKGTEKKGLTRE